LETLVVITLVLLGWLLGSAVLLFMVGVLHESGHALAALLLQPGPVTMHLGTYGQLTGNWLFRLGRLRIYLAYNKIWWRGGYCELPAMGQLARWQQVSFLLAGPLWPLLLAAVVAVVVRGHKPAFQDESYVAWLVLWAVVMAWLVLAVSGALFSLIPRRQPIILADGRRVHNDGQQLLTAWRRPGLHRALASQLQQAEAYRLAGEYARSAELYEAILPRAKATRPLLCTAIHVLLRAGRYAEALALSTQHHQDFAAEITDDDRFGHALLLSRTDQPALAMEQYSALIDQPHPYPLAYNNRGYTHNLLGNYELALADFNQAIALDIEPAYAHANRGLALLKLGHTAAGLAALDRSLALDPAQAYAFRNLGIHHLDRGEYTQAALFFEQAEQLDPTTHKLASYQQQTRQHLEKASDTGGPPQ
jgi:tetratricopeptide (TPR) repeat protein